MATKKTPVAYRKLGKLPTTRVTFYTDPKKKPTITVDAGWHVQYLSYKTETKDGKKELEVPKLRDKMAVALRRVDRTTISGDCIQVLIDAKQEELAKLCADDGCSIEDVESPQYLQSFIMDGATRMTEEEVTAWYDDNMEDFMFGRIQKKYPQWDNEKQAALVGQYRKLFGELTAKFLPQSEASANNMLKVWTDFVDAQEEPEGKMVDYITARITKLVEKFTTALDVDAV